MSTERKIQDYLHFYLGQKAIHPALKNPHPISGAWLDSMKEKEIKIKPILRPLSNMTKQEKAQSDKFNSLSNFELAEWFRYLLSRGFDLFDLIPDGLAIDKTTLKP